MIVIALVSLFVRSFSLSIDDVILPLYLSPPVKQFVSIFLDFRQPFRVGVCDLLTWIVRIVPFDSFSLTGLVSFPLCAVNDMTDTAMLLSRTVVNRDFYKRSLVVVDPSVVLVVVVVDDYSAPRRLVSDRLMCVKLFGPISLAALFCSFSVRHALLFMSPV